MKGYHDQSDSYKGKHLLVGWLTFQNFSKSWQEAWQHTYRHGAAEVLGILYLNQWKASGRERVMLCLAWAVETSKFTASGTLPPTMLHLSQQSNMFLYLQIVQFPMSNGSTFIQTTTLRSQYKGVGYCNDSLTLLMFGSMLDLEL